MKRDRQLDSKVMTDWVQFVGGFTAATRIIRDTLECSESKAQKLAGGSYDRLPTASEQIALAQLVQKPRDTLFPLLGSKGRKRAS